MRFRQHISCSEYDDWDFSSRSTFVLKNFFQRGKMNCTEEGAFFPFIPCFWTKQGPWVVLYRIWTELSPPFLGLALRAVLSLFWGLQFSYLPNCWSGLNSFTLFLLWSFNGRSCWLCLPVCWGHVDHRVLNHQPTLAKFPFRGIH